MMRYDDLLAQGVAPDRFVRLRNGWSALNVFDFGVQ